LEPPGDYESAKESALRLLERRPRTRTEILRRLGQSGVSSDTAQEVVDRLEELDLLSDRLVAQQVVREEVRKGGGDSRIRFKLAQAGVGRGDIQEAMDSMPPELDRALVIGLKRVSRLRGREPDSARKKLGSFLQGKGYGYDTVAAACEELLGASDGAPLRA